MKFLKFASAVAITSCALLSTTGTRAFAAQIVPTLMAQSEAQTNAATLQYPMTETPEVAGKEQINKSITIAKGETISEEMLLKYVTNCAGCDDYALATDFPVEYRVSAPSMANAGVVDHFNAWLAPTTDSSYAGKDALIYSFEGVNEGSTTLSFNIYYYVNVPTYNYFHPECGTMTRIPAHSKWLAIEVNLDITVEGTTTDSSKKESVPSMDKTILVNGIEMDRTQEAVPGQTYTFLLNSNIPGNLYEQMGELIHVEKVDEETGVTTTVIQGTEDYLLTFHDKFGDSSWILNSTPTVLLNGKELDTKYITSTEQECCDIHLTLNLTELFNDGVITNADIENAAPIQVIYTAQLRGTVSAGMHTNTAWVTYQGNESEKDIAIADIYGIQIVKQDVLTGAPLQGAQFTLKDKDGNVLTDSLISDENGMITISSIKPGVYTLEETKAPEGYIRSTKPITITVSKEAAELEFDDHYVEVTVVNSQAPTTGGSGTAIFTIVGSALLAGSAICFTINRKKKA